MNNEQCSNCGATSDQFHQSDCRRIDGLTDGVTAAQRLEDIFTRSKAAAKKLVNPPEVTSPLIAHGSATSFIVTDEFSRINIQSYWDLSLCSNMIFRNGKDEFSGEELIAALKFYRRYKFIDKINEELK